MREGEGEEGDEWEGDGQVGDREEGDGPEGDGQKGVMDRREKRTRNKEFKGAINTTALQHSTLVHIHHSNYTATPLQHSTLNQYMYTTQTTLLHHCNTRSTFYHLLDTGVVNVLVNL